MMGLWAGHNMSLAHAAQACGSCFLLCQHLPVRGGWCNSAMLNSPALSTDSHVSASRPWPLPHFGASFICSTLVLPRRGGQRSKVCHCIRHV
jgi:hypothetical protein